MSKWINLEALRAQIATSAAAQAEAAGLERVRVHVRIDQPDRRGNRHIEVAVTDAGPDGLAELRGSRWEDN